MLVNNILQRGGVTVEWMVGLAVIVTAAVTVGGDTAVRPIHCSKVTYVINNGGQIFKRGRYFFKRRLYR